MSIYGTGKTTASNKYQFEMAPSSRSRATCSLARRCAAFPPHTIKSHEHPPLSLFSSFFLLLSLSSFSVTPSAAQSFSTSTTTIPPPIPGVDNSTTSPNATSTTASTTTYVNLTTTDALGSTIVTSIPITVAPSTTPTTASSTPWPSLTGYPTCVTDCLNHAVAQVNCTSVVAVACYCTNRTFPDELYKCVASSCGTNVPSAENLAEQFCAIDNVTLTFSATAAPSTSTPSTTPSR
ncbi:hypothetical protein BC826DRAFT_1104345 [Russula brevipes]|nr:hypothetical protein BC826DRAFT_1104345 [Russula brevipes]